jgi:hypothetical protein
MASAMRSGFAVGDAFDRDAATQPARRYPFGRTSSCSLSDADVFLPRGRSRRSPRRELSRLVSLSEALAEADSTAPVDHVGGSTQTRRAMRASFAAHAPT